jgi:CheY-like chemotaxis protein
MHPVEEYCGSIVLVVEDDHELRAALLELLRDEGYEATGAANGKEALHFVEHIDGIGLILLDLRMPVMDGWQLLEIIRGRNLCIAAIPVVVVSSEDRHDVPLGIPHVPKPIDVPLLLRLVERHVSPTRADDSRSLRT